MPEVESHFPSHETEGRKSIPQSVKTIEIQKFSSPFMGGVQEVIITSSSDPLVMIMTSPLPLLSQ